MPRFGAILAAGLSNNLVGALNLRQTTTPYDAEKVPHWKTPYQLQFISKEKGTDNSGNTYTAFTYNLSTDAAGPDLNHSSLIIDPSCDFVKQATLSSNHSWQILQKDDKTDELSVIKTAVPQVAGESELRTIALVGDVEGCMGTYVVKENRGGVESYSSTVVPCCCDPSSSTCTIYGDPHITSFDGSRVSLLRKPAAASIRDSAKVFGDVWLVRSATVSIQGRALPERHVRAENLYLRAVAAGGRMMNGNVLVVGSKAENITWNGEHVRLTRRQAFEVPGLVRAVVNPKSRSVKDGKTRAAIEVSLPNDVRLTINRLEHHVNVEVAMPHAPTGRQEGLCGNFNGQADDDQLLMMTGARDPTVRAGDSLFQ